MPSGQMRNIKAKGDYSYLFPERRTFEEIHQHDISNPPFETRKGQTNRAYSIWNYHIIQLCNKLWSMNAVTHSHPLGFFVFHLQVWKYRWESAKSRELHMYSFKSMHGKQNGQSPLLNRQSCFKDIAQSPPIHGRSDPQRRARADFFFSFLSHSLNWT